LNYIEIYYHYNEVYYKYTQMHWKYIQILWCLLKYIYLPLRIHSYILIYILLPSKYITMPSKSLHTFDLYHNTIIKLQYPSIYIHICWNCLQIFLFCTFLFCHYTISPKLSWRLIILPRCHALGMTSLLESKNQAYSTNPIHLITSPARKGSNSVEKLRFRVEKF
jgi:hypothetical protein